MRPVPGWGTRAMSLPGSRCLTSIPSSTGPPCRSACAKSSSAADCSSTPGAGARMAASPTCGSAPNPFICRAASMCPTSGGTSPTAPRCRPSSTASVSACRTSSTAPVPAPGNGICRRARRCSTSAGPTCSATGWRNCSRSPPTPGSVLSTRTTFAAPTRRCSAISMARPNTTNATCGCVTRMVTGCGSPTVGGSPAARRTVVRSSSAAPIST